MKKQNLDNKKNFSYNQYLTLFFAIGFACLLCLLLFACLTYKNLTVSKNYTENLDAVNDITILLIFNGKEYAKEAENLLTSFKKFAPHRLKQITVAISDDEGEKIANKYNLSTIQLDKAKGSGTFRTHEYRLSMVRKVEGILKVLNTGKDLIYLDTDIVVLGDIVPLMLNDLPGYDMVVQSDSTTKIIDVSAGEICAGVMYIPSNQKNINWLNKVLKNMQDKKQHDQHTMRELHNDIKLKFLDPCKFVNGVRLWGWTSSHKPPVSPSCLKNEAILIHNNWITGFKEKEERFKNIGVYYL